MVGKHVCGEMAIDIALLEKGLWLKSTYVYKEIHDNIYKARYNKTTTSLVKSNHYKEDVIYARWRKYATNDETNAKNAEKNG